MNDLKEIQCLWINYHTWSPFFWRKKDVYFAYWTPFIHIRARDSVQFGLIWFINGLIEEEEKNSTQKLCKAYVRLTKNNTDLHKNVCSVESVCVRALTSENSFIIFFFLMFATYEFVNELRETKKNHTEKMYISRHAIAPLLRKMPKETHRSWWLYVWPWVLFVVFIEYHHHHHIVCHTACIERVCSLLFRFAKSANSFELPFLLTCVIFFVRLHIDVMKFVWVRLTWSVLLFHEAQNELQKSRYTYAKDSNIIEEEEDE